MIERLVKNTLSAYKEMPIEFCKDFLNMPLIWQGQQRILKSLVDNKRTTVPSGHSTGKSAIAAGITWWWLFTRFKSRVIVTAPTYRQLMTVYYAEVNKWYNNSALKDLNVFECMANFLRVNDKDLAKEWYMLPISPSTADGLQGQHGDKSQDVRSVMKQLGIEEIKDDSDIKAVIESLKNHSTNKESDDNLLIIIDEGSGVSQEIMEVLEGTDYTRLVIFGNMTKNTGMFYDSVYRSKGQFNVIRLSSYDSPFMSYEQIEYMENRYGKDSNVVKVRLKGEAPDQENDTIISRELLEKYIDYAPLDDKILNSKEIQIGVDVARFGDDSTIMYVKQGNYIIEEIKLDKKDTMQTANRVARIVNEYSQNDIVAKIDGVGVGGGVIDRLSELQFPNLNIIEIQNNARAFNENEYCNAITEMFYEFNEFLKHGFVSMPDDSELIEDLAGRKYEFDSKGRLRIESKDEFKKRFGRSPDKGDAFLMTWYNNEDLTLIKK